LLDVGQVEVNEVQLIECTCSTACSGGFVLDFLGTSTATIAATTTAAQLTTILTVRCACMPTAATLDDENFE
jgi:hypothetical protein